MADVLRMRQPRAAEYDDEAPVPEPKPNRSQVPAAFAPHKLDSEESRNELRQLLKWYYYERDRQTANRMEMALDHDFYDNLQWDPEDASIVTSRGQMPLVYNDVAPACDWVIGTERRTRVDWRVMPRAEDDVQAADIKTKVLKYHADQNRTAFTRSRAFADAVKGGVGWVDDGVRDDPTTDVLYSRYEHWRNVLWDSSALELDLSDARYLFRWRWVDEDIACMMFPDRAEKIRRAAEDWEYHYDPTVEEEEWPGTSPLPADGPVIRSGTLGTMASMEGAERRKVKLIECQYRKPANSKIVTSGPLKGMYYSDSDLAMKQALSSGGGTIIDKIALRVHIAVFLPTCLLGLGPSIFRHNRFSLTPIWCYRRNKDGQPYGTIRRVRDIQRDLNKRASKAQWLLNTNQIVMDEGAVEDIEEAREEAQSPDGVIVKKAGKSLEIRRDTDAATGQLQIMAMDSQAIQRSLGVTDENRGLKTNAVSGEAIRARQAQGSVVTTEPFDNLRYAVQVQGEKVLSLVEQFYTEEKVLRLTGARGAIEWVKVNQPEVQPDGSVRWINDITASVADFVVSEQDYAGTMRQVMFESISAITQSKNMPPELALRLLTLAFEFSDLPNKDELAGELRRMTGDRDPTKEMTPEEEQQAQQQQQMQQEAMEIQRQTALETLNEQRAKVREANARADQLEAQAIKLQTEAALGGGDQAAANSQLDAINTVREELASEIERLSAELVKAQKRADDKTMQIKTEADVATSRARIEADAKIRAAEIQKTSDEAINAVTKRIESMERAMEGRIDKVAQQAKEQAAAAAEAAKDAANKAAEAAKPAPAAAAPAPAPAPVAAAPVAQVQAPVAEQAAAAPGRRTFRPRTNKAGDIVGGVIEHEDGSTERLTVSYAEDGAIEEVQVAPSGTKHGTLKKPARKKE